jgi:hypothetical protein
VAIFGRKTARERLRKATRESLSIPAFSSPADCTPWVIGGLWPAELSMVTAETAPLADYLKADLQRIANSANEELQTLRRAGMADSARQAAEARVIRGARAYAARRVESTVRHLRKVARESPTEYRRPHLAEDRATTDVDKSVRPTAVAMPPIDVEASGTPAEPRQEKTEQVQGEPKMADQGDKAGAPIDSVEETLSQPETIDLNGVPATYGSESDVTEAIEAASIGRHAEAPVADAVGEDVSLGRHAKAPVDKAMDGDVSTARFAESSVAEATTEIPAARPEPAVGEGSAHVAPARYPAPPHHHAPTEGFSAARHGGPAGYEPVTDVLPGASSAEPPVGEAAMGELPAASHAESGGDVAAATRHGQAPVEPESDRQRLQRLLEFVARQEPGLRWAVGDHEDGTTVLLTDVAHGWVPPGIALPAGVQLLEPGWRTGNAAVLLGPTTLSATYNPGDSLGWAADSDATESSLQPRELPAVDDLGWLLGEATQWRDGLPRIVHTLAKAGAAGTGVADVEVDVLRVHLEIARYNLIAQYPDVDAALLLNCLLLAATEGIATGDRVSANYHFAWFQMLSTPPASKWTANR